MLDVISWWLTVQVLAMLFFPVSARFGQNLPDRGYSLSKAVGLLLPAYSLWILSSLGVLSNTRWSIVAVALVAGGLAWMFLPGAILTLRDLWRRERRMIILLELLFAAALLAWALVRAYEPQITATEKPMEFAFLNGVLRSERFPPVDPWMSGYSISYYYFGYVIVGMLSKLTGISAGVSFNLAIALLFALTVVGAFGVAYNLARAAQNPFSPRRLGDEERPKGGTDASVCPAGCEGSLHKDETGRAVGPLLCGMLGALFTAVMGNLEGLLEILHSHASFPLSFWQWVGIQNLDKPYTSQQWYPTDWMWWFRASRVIADYDPVSRVPRDYTINEFPSFSFLLGDLHPHVLALPFTILALGLALNLLLAESEPSLKYFRKKPWHFIGLALVVGGLGFLNSWDMPTYALVLAAAFAVKKLLHLLSGTASQAQAGDTGMSPDPSNARIGLPPWKAPTHSEKWASARSIALESAAFLVLLLVASVALYLPFYAGFSSQASGLGLVLVRSKLHQWLIFWAPFVFLSGSFVLAQLALRQRSTLPETRLQPAGQHSAFGASIPLVGGLLDAFGALHVWVTVLLLGIVAVVVAAFRAISATNAEPSGSRRAVTAFVMLTVLLAVGLLLATEIVFVLDFFRNRMNTVFKIYYQVWTLMAIAGAYVVYYFAAPLGAARQARNRREGQDGASGVEPGRPKGFNAVAAAARAGFAIAIVLLLLAFAYPIAAVASRTNGFQGQPQLDGMAYLAGTQRDEYDALNWLQSNVPGTPVILEASGGSYSEFGRVSGSTGIPTVLGWDGHELQWRGSGQEAAKRKSDVDAIYQTPDSRAAQQLLRKYSVSYVYVGSLERQKYGSGSPAWFSKFSDIGDVVYQNQSVTIFRIRVVKQG